jgi:hypothetical protein
LAGCDRVVALSGWQAPTVIVECVEDGVLPVRAHAASEITPSAHAGIAIARMHRDRDTVIDVDCDSRMMFRFLANGS